MIHFNGKKDYIALIQTQQSIKAPFYSNMRVHGYAFMAEDNHDNFLTFMFPWEDTSLPVSASHFKNFSQAVSSQRGDIL